MQWLCVAAAIAGCAGNGKGLDSNGRPLGSGGGDGSPLTADFQSIQDHVFTPICTVCHSGAGAPHGLRLDSANSYDLLVGVPSEEEPGLLRVKPGDPDHSYLIQKLEGRAAVGARMPLGGPYLDQATIDVLRQWIVDGAQRSAAAAAPAAFKVATVAPAPGAVVADSPAHVLVGFTWDLDQTRIDGSVISLERVEPGASDVPAAEVPVDVSVPDSAPSDLIVTPRTPVAPGRYRLRLNTAAIADVSGRSLEESDEDPTVTTFEVEGQP